MTLLISHRHVFKNLAPEELRLLDDWKREIERSLTGTPPVGAVEMYAGATQPDGWLFVNGQTVSRKSFPELFAVLQGNVSSTDTTFTLPDWTDRTPYGAGTAALLSTLGANSVTLTIDQIPTHGHALTDPGHGHGITDPGHTHTALERESGTGDITPAVMDNITEGNTGSATTGITVNSASTGITIADAGGGQSFDNRPASFAVHWIIKT